MASELVNNEKYEPSSLAVPTQSEKTLIRKLAMTHSITPAYTHARLVHNMDSTDAVEKYASEETPVAEDCEKLGKQYMAYKLAALNYLDEQNKLTDEILFNAVVQNLG